MEECILEGQSQPAARRSVIPKNIYRRIFRISIIYRRACGGRSVNLRDFYPTGLIIMGYFESEKRRGDCARCSPYILIESSSASASRVKQMMLESLWPKGNPYISLFLIGHDKCIRFGYLLRYKHIVRNIKVLLLRIPVRNIFYHQGERLSDKQKF